MIIHAQFDYEDLRPYIGLTYPCRDWYGQKIKMSSTRLELFKRNPICVSCQKRGSIFLIQSHVKGERPHLNFFHVMESGNLLLMTKDHIIPKSKGGSNQLDNLQTMCTACNCAKGNKLPGEKVVLDTSYESNLLNHINFNRIRNNESPRPNAFECVRQ